MVYIAYNISAFILTVRIKAIWVIINASYDENDTSYVVPNRKTWACWKHNHALEKSKISILPLIRNIANTYYKHYSKIMNYFERSES